MRVLIITNLYPNPYQPNRATYNRQHFRALGNYHEVRIVSPILWTDEWRFRRANGRKLTKDRRGVVDGIDVRYPSYLYTPRVLRPQYGRFYYHSIRSTVLDEFKKYRPDILMASWAYPDGYAAVRLASELQVASAIHVLGSDVNMISKYPGRSRLTEQSLIDANVVLTVSEDLARKVISAGVEAERVRVVYRGIDSKLFSPGSQEDARGKLGMPKGVATILFVGNLVPVKAVDVLLNACSKLKEHLTEFHCHIVGDGPLRRGLESQVKSMDLVQNVSFHGTVDHSQLPDWYRASDLVVLPSLNEGVPNVLLEAIACGTRYVASLTGGIPEISRHNGCQLVIPGDDHALADAILQQLGGGRPSPDNLPTASWDEAGRIMANVLVEGVQRFRANTNLHIEGKANGSHEEAVGCSNR